MTDTMSPANRLREIADTILRGSDENPSPQAACAPQAACDHDWDDPCTTMCPGHPYNEPVAPVGHSPTPDGKSDYRTSGGEQ